MSYLDFLKTVNGLDFSELVIYGVDEHLLDDQEDYELQGFVDFYSDKFNSVVF